MCPWNRGTDFFGHHVIACHKSSWLQIQNKVYPLVPDPAVLSCKLPSALTKTCSSLEDGVVRIRSSLCLLYRAVHPINVKVLDQEWSPLSCLAPWSAQKYPCSEGQKYGSRDTTSEQCMRQRKSFTPATLEANSRKLQFQGKRISLNSSSNRCP